VLRRTLLKLCLGSKFSFFFSDWAIVFIARIIWMESSIKDTSQVKTYEKPINVRFLWRFYRSIGTCIGFVEKIDQPYCYGHVCQKQLNALHCNWCHSGHDTTGSAISWCLYHLAKHRDSQERARFEVDRLLCDRDSPTITWYIYIYIYPIIGY